VHVCDAQDKVKKSVALPGKPEPDTSFRRKCRLTWAALIKCVYEVDPLTCPKCGGKMRVISFIEEDAVIEKILRRFEVPDGGRHCGLWKEPPIRPPPIASPVISHQIRALDYGFYERTCA
jgi:hypothetical protein